MYVLVTYKDEENQMKIEGARVVTTLGWFYFKFKLIKAFMVVLVTCMNEEDPFKNEGARVVTTRLHYPLPQKVIIFM